MARPRCASRRLSLSLPAEHRFMYQVDFGPWHDFVSAGADGVLTVEDSKLALVGHHTVSIKAMRGLDWSSLSEGEAAVDVWTDAEAPSVRALP